MPIVRVEDQEYNKVNADFVRTTGYKGKKPQTRMAPTPGSKTQRRKANRGTDKK